MDAAAATYPVNAEPYAFPFAPAACALVVIDMQRDFLEPGGFGAGSQHVSALVLTVSAISSG